MVPSPPIIKWYLALSLAKSECFSASAATARREREKKKKKDQWSTQIYDMLFKSSLIYFVYYENYNFQLSS